MTRVDSDVPLGEIIEKGNEVPSAGELTMLDVQIPFIRKHISDKFIEICQVQIYLL